MRSTWLCITPGGNARTLSPVLALALLLFASTARAGEFGVSLYGLSYHFERDRAQQLGLDSTFNPGVGVRYLIGENERFRWFADAGVYRDSSRETAGLAGVAAQWKATQALGLGLGLVVFKSDSYNQGRVFIAPLPVVSYEFKAVTLNLFYTPKVRELNDLNTLGFWITFWPGRL